MSFLSNIKYKEFARKLLRYTCEYKHWKGVIARSGHKHHDRLFEESLSYALDNVPFYKSYKKTEDLTELPVIRKSDIIGKEHLMVSSKLNMEKLRKVGTAGSTGVSLTLYRSVKDVIRELAEIDSLLHPYIPYKKMVKAVLRGTKPKSGIYERVSGMHHLLSSYLISKETVHEYIKILKEKGINIIHAYPTSIILLSRIIKQQGLQVDLPKLEYIFTSSEIFGKKEKELVKSVFKNVTIIDYYSHNEMGCAAFSVDFGPYNFLPTFGKVEFIDRHQLTDNTSLAEIVCTSILNATMPFVRYATEDYVELDESGRVLSIVGRSADFVINKNEDIVPCIISTREESMVNVVNFQYYQDKKGVLIYKVVVNDKFCSKDVDLLEYDLNSSFDGLMECRVEVVEEIPKTKAGKQKRLIQMLNL